MRTLIISSLRHYSATLQQQRAVVLHYLQLASNCVRRCSMAERPKRKKVPSPSTSGEEDLSAGEEDEDENGEGVSSGGSLASEWPCLRLGRSRLCREGGGGRQG